MSPEQIFGLRHLSIFILSTQRNVLISNDCTARLVDVGIKGVLAVLYSIDTGTLNSKIDGTRYMAPELLLLDNVGGLTKECDIH